LVKCGVKLRTELNWISIRPSGEVACDKLSNPTKTANLLTNLLSKYEHFKEDFEPWRW